MTGKALVIFSGGQDSTTCLGWAKNRYQEVEAITFIYGQRHSIEIEKAKIIANKLNVKIHIFDISVYSELIKSALTGDGKINQPHEDNKNLPASFVPNRNAMFILLAHSFAQKIKIDILVSGFCEADFSGYPDCREDFTTSMINTLNLGSDQKISLETPLMHINKAETFKLAEKEGVFDIVIEDSHTCYEGVLDNHEWGNGCGKCPACKLREKGYNQYKQQFQN